MGKITSLPPAVVLTEGATTGLGVVRSLQRADIPSVVVSLDPGDFSLVSRYPIARYSLKKDPDTDISGQLLDFLLRRSELGGAVLVPTADNHVSFVIQREADLARRGFQFCLPPRILTEALIDKTAEVTLMRRIGVPLPKTAISLPSDPSTLVEMLGTPIIMKPRSHVEMTRAGRKNFVLRSEEALRRFYCERRDSLGDFLAQEVIPGADDSLWAWEGTFNRSSELVQVTTVRKLGMSPPHFGLATLAISASNPEVCRLIQQIGKAIGYVGPAVGEFKFDSRDGAYKYIEINPGRVGGWNFQSTLCGVNNSWCAYRVYRGEDVPPLPLQQRDGVIFFNFFGDLHARHEDGQSPALIARLYLRYTFHRRVGGFFAWSDPLPGLTAAARNVRAVLRSFGRRFRAHMPMRRPLIHGSGLTQETPDAATRQAPRQRGRGAAS